MTEAEKLDPHHVALREAQRSRALLKLCIEHPELLIAGPSDKTAALKLDIVVQLAYDYADKLWARYQLRKGKHG